MQAQNAGWGNVTILLLRDFAEWMLEEGFSSTKNFVMGAYLTARDKHGVCIDRDAYLLLLQQVSKEAARLSSASQARIIFEDDIIGLSSSAQSAIKVLIAMGQRSASIKRLRLDIGELKLDHECERISFIVRAINDKKMTEHAGFCNLSSQTIKKFSKVLDKVGSLEGVIDYALEALNSKLQDNAHTDSAKEKRFSFHSFRRTCATLIRLLSPDLSAEEFICCFHLQAINAHIGWKPISKEFTSYTRDASSHRYRECIKECQDAVKHLLKKRIFD